MNTQQEQTLLAVIEELLAVEELHLEHSRLKQRRDCWLKKDTALVKTVADMHAEYKRRKPLALAAARRCLIARNAGVES